MTTSPPTNDNARTLVGRQRVLTLHKQGGGKGNDDKLSHERQCADFGRAPMRHDLAQTISRIIIQTKHYLSKAKIELCGDWEK